MGVGLLLALAIGPASAIFSEDGRQVSVADPAAREICASVGAVDAPPGDRPDAAERPSLAGCSSIELYFGLGRPADPVRARKCAYVEMESGANEPLLGGTATLMMVYANGRGARRNFDLALKLACTIRGAPQDVAGRVHQLARLKAANWNGDRFSICDHSSGRELYEQCAILQDRFDSVERARKLDAITRKWTEAERAAFVPLRRAADAFFRARAATEINLESTVQVQERAFLEDSFIRSLQQFDEGDTPGFSADERREAETNMQSAYAQTQADKARRWGTVSVDAIRQTQDLWIAYRDAWLTFARTKYPTVGAATWYTWLTRERADVLSRFTLVR